MRLFDAAGENVCFDEVDLAGARADGASPDRSRAAAAPGSIWEGADLVGSGLLRGPHGGSWALPRERAGAVLSAADLTGACFRRADLRRAQLLKANLMEATFESADLTGRGRARGQPVRRRAAREHTEGLRTDLAIVARTKLDGQEG